MWESQQPVNERNGSRTLNSVETGTAKSRVCGSVCLQLKPGCSCWCRGKRTSKTKPAEVIVCQTRHLCSETGTRWPLYLRKLCLFMACQLWCFEKRRIVKSRQGCQQTNNTSLISYTWRVISFYSFISSSNSHGSRHGVTVFFRKRRVTYIPLRPGMVCRICSDLDRTKKTKT